MLSGHHLEQLAKWNDLLVETDKVTVGPKAPGQSRGMASTLLQTHNAVFIVASVEPEKVVPAQLQPVCDLVADVNLQ